VNPVDAVLNPPGRAPLWHGMTASEVERELATNLTTGLAPDEITKRRALYGPNALHEGKTRGPWRMFAAQFADFMIVVLLVAGVVAGFLGEPLDSAAIAAIVILNAILGFVQEYRAEKAMAALKRLAAQQARVVREGQAATVPAADLVPGDVVLLEAGNSVPADLRICEAAQLRADEAALTGESHPAEKSTRPAAADPDLPLGDRTCMAYKGTVVTYGRGRGIVVSTGMSTELGRIAGLLEEPGETKTPLQKRLAQFGKYLALAALAICAIVFATGVQRGEPVLRMFLTAVSLAVAAIPEALPAVVTITLALGAQRMLKVHALVRRLPAVETLGSVTYNCSDKTGTLTENRMRLTQIYADGVYAGVESAPRDGEPWRTLLTALALSNDASRDNEEEETSGDPTEAALLDGAAAAGYGKAALERRLPRVAERAFDSERRRMTTLHQGPEGVIAFTKGAPEAVLNRCTRMLGPEGEEDLDSVAAMEAAGGLAAQGLRVLALSYRRFAEVPEAMSADQIEDSLTFLGLVGLIDPPRAEAREAVALAQRAGIVPVMITGDHPATARAIGEQIGICPAGGPASGLVISGPELARLDADALDEQVRRLRVYARVDPTQKVRIVEALQRQGELVAMTGDGINDAPALKRADIGVAMGKGGTDIAREASDLVLLDDNFATIVAAAREGRHIFDNIRKFVNFIMASNAAEILTIFLAPFLGLPVPLLPIHILWTNLVTDGLPGLALAVEPEERSVMLRPPRPPRESLFARGVGPHMIWVGILIAGLSIFSQAYIFRTGNGHWQTMVFTVLTLSQMTHVMAVRSETEPLWRIGLGSNLPLLGAVSLTFVLQMAAVYLPLFQRIFRTAPLSAGELAFALGLCMLVYLAVEVEKWMARRGWIYQGG
jgi:Ca2+-transporting ATPase